MRPSSAGFRKKLGMHQDDLFRAKFQVELYGDMTAAIAAELWQIHNRSFIPRVRRPPYLLK
jgi:hypothetical protein